MAIELRIPSAGESISEVQVGMWLKKEGDTVQRDEPVVEIDTDKVSMEVTAPASGTITKVLIPSGTTAKVGDVVAVIEEGAVSSSTPAAPAAAPKKAPTAPIQKLASAPVMPAAQRAMHDAGVSPANVDGTGRGGRILKEDVERAAAKAPAAAPARPSAPAPRPTSAGGPRDIEVVPLTPMRRTIAQRLIQSQQSTATLTTYNEIDMSRTMEMRKLYKDAFKEKYGVNLGFMSFFVKAAIDALKLVPTVNAELREDGIVYHNYYDIGVAVGGGKGLVVPIIRNAERLSFAEVEMTIADFGARAKENKIKLEELQGGTFTITNGGIYGSMMSTPIINPPQTGILGMHAIKDRALVVDGQVVVRPVMYVALSYDHRLIDGREAVTFLKRIKEGIEAPERMLIEI